MHTNNQEVPDAWMPMGKQIMPQTKQIQMDPVDLPTDKPLKTLFPTVVDKHYKQ